MFQIGDNSFGEVYHLALHAILLPSHSRCLGVRYVGQHAEVMKGFFDDLEIPYSHLHTPIDPMHRRGLSETATTILNRYHRDQAREKAKIIREMACENRWDVPFPSLRNPAPKVLIWQRNETYEPWRNSSPGLTRQLAELCLRNGAVPVIFGPQIGISGAIEFPEFFKDEFFSAGRHNICKQLWFQDALFTRYGVKASVGMMSGIMDGAAMFFGHKTVFFARSTDAQPRMAKVAMAVPGLHWLKSEYDDYLATLGDGLIADIQEIIWPAS